MSLFDDIVSSFYLTEDNTGDDDEQNTENQNQNQEGNEPTPAAEDNQDGDGDSTGGEEGEGADNGDEYQMNDPEVDDAGGEEGTDDNQEEGGDDNQNQGEEDEYQMNDPEADDTGEGNDQGAEGEEGNDGNEDEYQMNDPEADDTGEGGEGTDDTAGSEPTDDPSSKLKDIEKSIFDQLTSEQQAAKTKELKSLYNDTYNKCQTIVDMVSTAEKEPSQAKVYDYIINNLVDLQKYIRDYLDDIFDSKTYIENMTELQKYLAILDTINNVFEEIKKGSETQAK